MKVKRIRYCCYGARIASENRHPQVVMSELGITYEHATPQSMGDQWWFWIPHNMPEKLPDFITVSEHDPLESIGFGLSKDAAEKLRDYKGS